MKKINKFFYNIIFLFLIYFPANADNKILSIGNSDAKITVKVFSSLTCPHCANFHEKIFNNLKKNYIDNGKVKFEHHSFPLDLAALNAELIVRCQKNSERSFELLTEIYKKQKTWAVGSDIMKINNLLKKIGLDFGLKNNDMEFCLENEKSQDQILNERIEAQKNYKIQSTPTIYINEKKYNGKHEFKDFKKTLEKNL